LDSITLDALVGGVRATLNNETVQFDPGQISSITVHPADFGSWLYIERTLAGVPVTVEYAGPVLNVYVSPTAHNLNTIQGAVTITPSNATLDIDDQSNGASQTISISPTSVSRLGPALITYDPFSALNVNGGDGNDTFNVNGTPYGDTTLTVGHGHNAVNLEATAVGAQAVFNLEENGGYANLNVSPSAHNLNAVHGVVNFDGGSGDHLVLNDQNNASYPGYILRPHSIVFGPTTTINFPYMVNDVTLYGGSGNNSYSVRGTHAGQNTTLYTGNGHDTVSLESTSAGTFTINEGTGGVDVWSSSANLSDIHGVVNVHGGIAGVDNLLLYDYLNGSDHTFTVGTDAVTRTDSGAIHYDSLVDHVNIVSGPGTNTFNVQGTGTATDIEGSGGATSLFAPDAANTWNIIGHNAGTLVSPAIAGTLTFGGVQNLHGGAGSDTFVFADGAGVDGTIDGGGGTNTLNYSAYSSSVIVDLQTGSATGVGQGIAHIQNVTGGTTGGGAGVYNVLVGNGGNVLTGCDGRRNLLIAGATASTLIGGNDDDILIGGTTAYDTEAGLASLQAVMAYWSGTADGYATRVINLLSGSGVPLLDATKVTSNGGGNTLLGNHGGAGELNLFYGLGPASETTDYNPALGEQFINC
jgi:hypothetical protein